MKFTTNGNQKWVNILKDVVNDYNNSYQSSVKMSPRHAYENPERVKIEFEIGGKKKNTRRSLDIGDQVYIYKWKDTFEKGRKGYWKISEKFYISRIINSNPVTYIIADNGGEEILGSFYANQLLKTA